MENIMLKFIVVVGVVILLVGCVVVLDVGYGYG